MDESNVPGTNVEVSQPSTTSDTKASQPSTTSDVPPQGLLSAQPDASDPTVSPEGTQETYADLTFPEGFTPDKGLVEDLKALAARVKLPREEAQKLADLGVKLHEKVLATINTNWVNTVGGWSKSMRDHPTLGGEQFEKNLRIAQLPFDDDKMQQRFGVPLVSAALRQILNIATPANPSGLALHCHPAVFEHFHTLGRLVGDDTLIAGAGGGKEMTTRAKLKQWFPNT